jgi:fatty-acyl-CoA synthase
LWNKLGHLTVERQDITQSLSDLEEMENALKSGKSLLIFPEGTFTSVPGLRPFKTGAFKLAVDTGTPICPIAIKGARDVLPDPSRTLRPGPIEITVYPPIYPESKDWTEVLKLSAMARAEIAKDCGEPMFEVR